MDHPSPIRRAQLPGAVIEIWESGHVRTTLVGRYTVEAAAEDTDAYRQTAKDLGYDDLGRMCAEHEAMHSYLAAKLSGGLSPTLLHVAGAEQIPIEERQAEEALVLAAQRYLNVQKESGLAVAFRIWLWGNA